MAHPYVTFLIVPTLPGGISLPIDIEKLDESLRNSLEAVSNRNKHCLSDALYERVKASRNRSVRDDSLTPRPDAREFYDAPHE